MSIETQLMPKVIVKHTVSQELDLLRPVGNGGWLATYSGGYPQSTLLSSELEEIANFAVGGEIDCFSASVGISFGHEFLAVPELNGLRILAAKGLKLLHRIEHPHWDSYNGSQCLFDAKDRLWYVCPSEDLVTAYVVVIDPVSGATLYRERIFNPAGDGAFHLFLCPGNLSMIIDVCCGQHGLFPHLAKIVDSRLEIQKYSFSDRIFDEGFSPNGREFVTVNDNLDSIMVHAFPDGKVLRSFTSHEVFGDQDNDMFYYGAFFVDNDHIIVNCDSGRAVLIRNRDMKVLGSIATRNEVQGPAYLSWIQPAEPGMFLCVHHRKIICKLDCRDILMELSQSRED